MQNYSSTTRQVSDADISIGFTIRQLRTKRRLSQTEVARALGISFQQFQKYEQGKNRIPASRLVEIAKVIGVTPHDILRWSNDGMSPGALDPACQTVDRKAADLWHRIQNEKYRRALMFLMETIDREHALQPQVGTKSQKASSEVEK